MFGELRKNFSLAPGSCSFSSCADFASYQRPPGRLLFLYLFYFVFILFFMYWVVLFLIQPSQFIVILFNRNVIGCHNLFTNVKTSDYSLALEKQHPVTIGSDEAPFTTLTSRFR